MAWRSGLRDWVKIVKAKTMFKVKKHRKYSECPHQSVCDYFEWHLHFQAPTVIICFSICGWSAVRPSNVLQGCIWGDNLRKQWAFALFPEQHHHQNLLKSKTKNTAKHKRVKSRSGWNLESGTYCSPSNQCIPTSTSN